jgi:nitrogen fixation protein FixH
MSRTLTGRHVLIIALAAFGTVIAANLTMLFAATGSFPGLIVGNSYVASQDWDERAQAQAALGWHADARWADGRLVVALSDAAGAPVRNVALEALVGRPTLVAEDRTVGLVPGRDGHAAALDLSPGLWRVEIRTVDGPAYTLVRRIRVPGSE